MPRGRRDAHESLLHTRDWADLTGNAAPNPGDKWHVSCFDNSGRDVHL